MTTRLQRYTASTRRARTWRVRLGKWKRFTQSKTGGTMSIEIEVGFENATKMPRTLEELSLEETPKGLANPKVRRLLIGGGPVALPAIASPTLYFPTPTPAHTPHVT